MPHFREYAQIKIIWEIVADENIILLERETKSNKILENYLILHTITRFILIQMGEQGYRKRWIGSVRK